MVFLIRTELRCTVNHTSNLSRHELFIKLYILPPHSQYILSPLLLVVKTIEEFIQLCSSLYQHSTKVRLISTINKTKYKRGVYDSGIKIFNHLPENIKKLSWNVQKFKLALKRFLLMGSFYTLNEYFEWISRKWSWYVYVTINFIQTLNKNNFIPDNFNS